jgi:hypothetical protein
MKHKPRPGMELDTQASLDYKTAGNQRLPGGPDTDGMGHLLVAGGSTTCLGSTCCSCSY